MTTTYVAWNGQSYPWPPPEGWYKASDGQWWAPGTGPYPLPANHPANTTNAPPPPRPRSTPVTTVTDARPASTSLGRGHDTAGPSTGTAALADAATARPDHGPTGPLPTVTANDHQQVAGRPSGTAEPRSRARPQRPAQPGSTAQPQGTAWLPQSAGVIAIAAAAVVVVGAGLFALLGGSDDAADTGTGNEIGEEAITSSTTDGSTGSADLAPTRSATLTTTTGPEAPVDTEAQETPTEAISPPAVAHLREILADGGLDSGLLTDANLEDFGDTFCVFAAVADDSTEFAELRARTTGQSTADGPDAADALTEEELARTIDAAVVAFCPDQAERLGLVG